MWFYVSTDTLHDSCKSLSPNVAIQKASLFISVSFIQSGDYSKAVTWCGGSSR